jgi:septal ring factor EnvC (AmiA/AmiB activator)
MDFRSYLQQDVARQDTEQQQGLAHKEIDYEFSKLREHVNTEARVLSGVIDQLNRLAPVLSSFEKRLAELEKRLPNEEEDV